MFDSLDSINFCVFECERLLGRENVMPVVTYKILDNLDITSIIDQEKLACFLDRIYMKYSRSVQYHNDLHGIDITQMGYRMLTQGNLGKILKLNKLDMLSFVTAGICHDVGHDGFNNSFHMNATTQRAIDSNDVSVQETFHAAEYFKTLQEECSNFIHMLSKNQFKLLRKRVIGMILATDMAKHASDLSTLKSVLVANQIENGVNNDFFANVEDENLLFSNQQMILEICMHTCDVSIPTREFHVVKKWTYLLFEEFFA